MLVRGFSRLIASGLVILVAFGLASCGDSRQAGWTARTPPPDPSDYSMIHPTQEMADETEALLADRDWAPLASPKCIPADSLDGVGEFNFDCTARDPRRGERVKLDVVVFGSESGEPELGSVLKYIPPGKCFRPRWAGPC
jgi:hypothetical protein